MSNKWAYQDPSLENADVKAELDKRKVWIETVEQFATWYNNQSKADSWDVKNLGEYIGVWAAKFFDEKMS